MTPEAARAALYAWRDQRTAMLAEPADGEDRGRWQRGRDHGRRAACKHDQRRPAPTLDLETGQSTGALTLPEQDEAPGERPGPRPSTARLRMLIWMSSV